MSAGILGKNSNGGCVMKPNETDFFFLNMKSDFLFALTGNTMNRGLVVLTRTCIHIGEPKSGSPCVTQKEEGGKLWFDSRLLVRWYVHFVMALCEG